MQLRAPIATVEFVIRSVNLEKVRPIALIAQLNHHIVAMVVATLERRALVAIVLAGIKRLALLVRASPARRVLSVRRSVRVRRSSRRASPMGRMVVRNGTPRRRAPRACARRHTPRRGKIFVTH